MAEVGLTLGLSNWKCAEARETLKTWISEKTSQGSRDGWTFVYQPRVYRSVSERVHNDNMQEQLYSMRI